ncbi:MAG: hypothetical protein L6Q83_04575 [Gammaproteobacteria bacterium]|nr:hypothetical protein [Gammaproteobacteria bacterium]
MTRKSELALAISAALLADKSPAASISVNLLEVREHLKGSHNVGNITSSTATWSYDDVSGLLSQTGGTFNVRFTMTPTTRLYHHSIAGLAIGNGGAASASSFVCTEGNFGGNVGASLCGNYSFGANFLDESTVTWGPGTAAARTLGGDDMALGAQATVALYDAFGTVSWDGHTLTIGNMVCNPAAPGSLFCQGHPYPYNANEGYSFVLSEAPVPVHAAAWLFGAGLRGLMSRARRRAGPAMPVSRPG